MIVINGSWGNPECAPCGACHQNDRHDASSCLCYGCSAHTRVMCTAQGIPPEASRLQGRKKLCH